MKPVAFAPAYLWLIPLMTEIAREHGYALAVHGSINRDLDLIAVPWVEEVKPATELVEALKQCVCGNIRAFVKGADGQEVRVNPEHKPHGRIAWSIHMQYPHLYIDLSVMPTQLAKNSRLHALLEEAERRLLRAAEFMRRNYPINAVVYTDLAARIKTALGQTKGSE